MFVCRQEIHLKQILQQDDPLPDVGWISRPHKTPAVFKLGGGAHLEQGE